MSGLTTGELAKRGGVNLESIRFYEREKLLPKPPRTASGYRMFSEDAVRRVRFIKRAQELGFTLTEVEELLRLRSDQVSACAEVKATAEAKIEDIEQKIQHLRAMKRALGLLSASCETEGSPRHCPILESLNGQRIARAEPTTRRR